MRKDWQTQRLADVCEKITDGSHNPPKGVECSNYLMLSSKNVFDDNLHFEDPRYLSESDFRLEDKRTGIKVGDVLLTIVGTIGRSAVIPPHTKKLALQRSVAVIRPEKESLSPRFLMYFFISHNDVLNDQSRGVAQKGIYLETLRDLPVDFPPLPEQQRIVGILDEAFDGLATAKANAETNLHNARALFESHLQSAFTQQGKGWEKLQLISVCDLFVDSAHRTPKYQDDGIPALRPRDVVNGKLNLEGALRVCEEEYEIQSKRYKPKSGDIVYSRELSYGWAALLPKSPRVCLSQGMCLFRPSFKLEASFLLYVLNGSIGREQATRAAVGAAHPHINLGDMKSYLIPMPPLEIQRQIIEQLNALQEETQRLESIYQQKLAALDELKKSLLHQAFTGQL